MKTDARAIMPRMADDDESENTAIVESSARARALATLDAAVADPRMLVDALMYVQERIPGFVVLPVRERRSMGNAGHLDPKFVEIGIQAATVFPGLKPMLGRSGEELRDDQEEIRQWDEVERHLRAITKGIADANLRRKYQLGNLILTFYGLLRTLTVDRAYSYLQPFYEEMQKIYIRTRGKQRATAKEGEPETS
jgi:hypothetical protein